MNKFENIVIGYVGETGGYGEQASKKFAEQWEIDNVEYKPFENANRLKEGLEDKSIDFGVFELRNSYTGVHEETAETLGTLDYVETDRIVLENHYTLYIKKDADIRYINKIYADNEVLEQCKNTCIKLIPNCELYSMENKDVGARYLEENRFKVGSGILCCKEVGNRYESLVELYKDIEDNTINTEYAVVNINNI